MGRVQAAVGNGVPMRWSKVGRKIWVLLYFFVSTLWPIHPYVGSTSLLERFTREVRRGEGAGSSVPKPGSGGETLLSGM